MTFGPEAAPLPSPSSHWTAVEVSGVRPRSSAVVPLVTSTPIPGRNPYARSASFKASQKQSYVNFPNISPVTASHGLTQVLATFAPGSTVLFLDHKEKPTVRVAPRFKHTVIALICIIAIGLGALCMTGSSSRTVAASAGNLTTLNRSENLTAPLERVEPLISVEPLRRTEQFLSKEPLRKLEPFPLKEPFRRAESFFSTEPLRRTEPFFSTEPLRRGEPFLSAEPLRRSESFLSTEPLRHGEPVLSMEPPLRRLEPLPLLRSEQLRRTEPQTPPRRVIYSFDDNDSDNEARVETFW